MRITWNDSDKEYNVIFNIQVNAQETWIKMTLYFFFKIILFNVLKIFYRYMYCILYTILVYIQ